MFCCESWWQVAVCKKVQTMFAALPSTCQLCIIVLCLALQRFFSFLECTFCAMKLNVKNKCGWQGIAKHISESRFLVSVVIA